MALNHIASSAAAVRSPAVAKRPRGRPPKTDDERDDGNRRRELIAAAAHLFRQRGYDATSTRDIAAAVGMRSGSPFYHFKSKQDLLGAVMEEGMRNGLLRQAAALAEVPPSATPRQVLARLIRSHFDVLLGPDSDFIPVMLYERRSLTAQQRQRVAALQAEYEKAWVPTLQALLARGQLRGQDPSLARLLIFGALNWAAQWYDPSQRAGLDELAGAALTLFIAEDTPETLE